jgi:pyruvate kinase
MLRSVNVLMVVVRDLGVAIPCRLVCYNGV